MRVDKGEEDAMDVVVPIEAITKQFNSPNRVQRTWHNFNYDSCMASSEEDEGCIESHTKEAPRGGKRWRRRKSE